MSLFLSIGLRTPLLHSILAYRFQTRRWYYPLMALVWPLVYCYVTFYEPDKFEKMGIPKDKLRLIEVTVHVSREQKNQVAPVDNPSIGITGNPLVVSAGRLHPHKGHEYVIRAWKNVVRELPDARLAIAGEGDDEERLRRLVSALDLEEHVDFTGYLQDLESLFKRATIYVRASLNEGTNLTTILAMSIGVPTIGFRNADVKEIIDDGVSGLLVPYKNEKKLAEEIIRLSKDADLQHRMSEAAIATIHQQYSLAEAVENYKNLYQSIIFPAKLDE